jgi:benzoyl-CoA 2,3-dioxygenase component B
MRQLHRFHGGVHPPTHKAESTRTPIALAALPSRQVIPMHQHVGNGAIPVVQVGEHVLKGQMYKILDVQNGQLVEKDVPMLNALNEVLRDDYIKDSVGGVERWNRIIEKAGVPFKLKVPHKAFHRNIGTLAGVKVSPEGRVVSDHEWNQNVEQWLPTDEDRAYVGSLMGRVVEPGKFANWIAPPVMGINRQPVNFEYVRFN